MNHLLVTNDFPPKVGGIQSYLWELWRRLPPERTTVLTTPYEGASEWDAEQAYRVERTRQPVLAPEPLLARQIDRLADEVDAGIVLLDPALPVGLVGPHLRHPYGVVLHGAEVAIPARIPGANLLQRRVLRGARLVVAAGPYPAEEGRRSAGRELPTVVVPPGVDTGRFVPLDAEERRKARVALGLPEQGRLVVSVSRLVPRKGMDTLVRAAALLAPERPDLTVAIAGSGRERDRLDALVAETGAPVHMLGRVVDERLPALYGCADVFAMLCRNRWSGLEQEGFGIVFLEAAACGVPQVAGDSGGAADAVTDGETGLIARHADDPEAVAGLLAELLDDPGRGRTMGEAGRRRAVEQFSYDLLAQRLDDALEAL